MTRPLCTRGEDSLRLESDLDQRILPSPKRRQTIRPALPPPRSSVTYTRPSSIAGVDADRLPSLRAQTFLPVSSLRETSRASSESCRMWPCEIAGGNSVSAVAFFFHFVRNGPRIGLAGSKLRLWSFV